ncbi:hypothetical protein GUJ93_ZPchr0010g9968 [Zizania palustris]|uniref:Non-haem dioxygenase N-terminal domain-containing protein n=1 Tax=Zizania palustris TaxID=103762 RepID=A0A8J5VVW5_ZIZPA|nr:hypothetical protein GUJ93_ZPchr0010g9968 [Zizania palustris]
MAARNRRSLDLPVVDLASPDLGATVESVRKACVDSGFFYVVSHGIKDGLLEKVFVESRKLFELPLEEKMALRRNSYHRGYTPPYAEKLDASSKFEGPNDVSLRRPRVRSLSSPKPESEVRSPLTKPIPRIARLAPPEPFRAKPPGPLRSHPEPSLQDPSGPLQSQASRAPPIPFEALSGASWSPLRQLVWSPLRSPPRGPLRSALRSLLRCLHLKKSGKYSEPEEISKHRYSVKPTGAPLPLVCCIPTP